MRRFLPLIIIMLLGMSAPLFAKKNPAKLLNQNLEQWQQFRWQGIIQVESSAFSMRKNFVLAKTKDEVRLDVLDSGVMGLQAKPLASIYLKDSIILEAPAIAQLQGIDLNWFVPAGMVKSLIAFTDSLKAGQQQIISKRKLVTAQSVFNFDKKYRLSKISNAAFGMEATVTYNNRSQPTKILVSYQGAKVAELQINERTDQDIEIVPLENKLDFQDILDGIDLEKLMDELPLDATEVEPD